MDNKLYRWVKASERLPEGGEVIFRTPNRDGLRKVFCLDIETDLKKFFSPFQLWEIEWLEPIADTSQEEIIESIASVINEAAFPGEALKHTLKRYILIKR